MGDRLTRIRESEKASHIETYSRENLYDKNIWLQKPIKTVQEPIPLFSSYKELRVLDLGCGIGHNSICIAETYQTITCTVDCVDLLEIAIEKLKQNAKEYGVRENGIVCLVINSNVRETNAETGEALEAQFEVNLPTEKLQLLLEDTFSDWNVLKTGVAAQEYDIPRNGIISHLDTNVVTFVAQRTRLQH